MKGLPTKLILLFLFFSAFQAFSQEKKWSVETMDRKLKTAIRPKVLRVSNAWTTVSDSAENGKYRLYHDKEMKMLLATGQIAEHKKVGTWVYYYPNGKKNLTIFYKDGKMEGTLTKFTYAGDTAVHAQMKDDKANGTALNWSDYNADMYPIRAESKRYLMSKAMYRNDTLIAEKNFYPTGEIVMESVQKGDTIVRTSYSSSGQIMEVYYFVNNKTVKTEILHNQSPETTYSLRIDVSKIKDQAIIEDLSSYVNLQSLTIYIPEKQESTESFFKDIIDRVASIESLTALYINSSVDHDLSKVQTMSQLRTLNLTCNSSINPAIMKLANLDLLVLNGKVSGDGSTSFVLPSSIKDLKKLQCLKINNIKFKNPESELIKLKSLTKLYALSLRNCAFEKAPLALGSLKQISYLDLAGAPDNMKNQITSLPDTILKLKNLRYLSLPESMGYEAHTTLLPKYRKRMPLCVFDIYFTCFPEDVQIMLQDGTEKSIKEINTGDVLLCYNASNQSVESTIVLETGCNQLEIKTEIEIVCSGSLRNLRMTPEHPVFVKGRDWQNASQLKVGDQIIHYDPETKAVSEFSIVQVKTSTSLDTKYYNLKTSKASYFANGIWVHNK